MGEIRMLNLFRCGLAEEFKGLTEKTEDAGEEVKNFFVTDYFDSIKVERQDEKTATLSECMGIQGEANTKTGVSHQRFCLYSTEDSGHDIFNKEVEYPVLMVIQLFINPDIYQASSFVGGEEISRNALIGRLNRFIEKKNHGFEVKWRIYQLLTVGDLAVVIRAKKVHAAYDICTMVRSLCVSVKSGEQTLKEAAFFSYSICGIVDGDEHGESGKWREYLEPQDQVSLRIKYTYTFRRRFEENSGLKQKLLANGKHLIGRYDHQMSLTPDEFQKIYPLLKWYKLKSEEIRSDVWEGCDYSEKTKILAEMMRGGHISYINEQLLLNYEKDVNLDGEQDEEWGVLCETGVKWSTLYERNDEKIEAIGERVEKLEGKMETYYQSARNLKEYLRLLGRLNRVFHEINKLKELRISVANALIQYETLIVSFENYVGPIPGGKEKFYADIIEENLQYGIRALEIFTRYIRNVNLQSFQTPNYDLQTNMSIEKILLAYSQFLKPYVLERGEGRPCEMAADFQPLIVPSMGVRDLSVAVVFGNDIRSDKAESNRKLMVVYSPTFSFLCETCFQLSAVFHEMAHQFRYEDRGERNQCLQKSILMKFIQLLVLNILDKNGEYDLAESPLVRELVKVVYRDVFPSLIPAENQEECLARFRKTLCAELTGFCRYASESGRTLRAEVDIYLEKTKKGVQEYDKKAVGIISKIADCLDKVETKEKEFSAVQENRDFSKSLNESVQNLVKAVRELKICQEDQIFQGIIKELHNLDKEKYKVVEAYEELWKNMSVQHDNSEQIGMEAFRIWQEEKENLLKNTNVDKEQIVYLLKQYHNVNAAYRYFWQYAERYPISEEVFSQKVRYQKLFEALCESLQRELPGELNSLLKSRDEELKWSAIAISSEYLDRYMKELRIKGKKGMADKLKKIFQLHSETWLCEFVEQDVSIYREVTSDLFMCAAMELDFFGYLIVAAEMLKFNRWNEEAQMDRVSYVLQCLYAKAAGIRNGSGITAQDFHSSIEKRVKEEIKILLCGLHEVAVKEEREKEIVKKWPGNHEFINWEEINSFLEDCIKIETLTSTQKWIIRVYRQAVAIVRKRFRCEINANIIGREEIWNDITSDKAYSFNEGLRNILEKNRDCKIYGSITEILNSPAKFFAKRRAILFEELDFILDQYERNCKNIFKGQGGEECGIQRVHSKHF